MGAGTVATYLDKASTTQHLRSGPLLLRKSVDQH